MSHINKKTEFILVLFLMLLSLFPRVNALGYSHFYGDEIKVLYLDKTIPATQFLLDQRKGPMQFLVAWFVESVTNSYAPQLIRLPFAIAGFFAVLVFYFLIKEWINIRVALIATTLFSFNGFFVAFSRTAQYQSFLLLFGFISLLLILLAVKNLKYKSLFLVGASLFMTLAMYSHYDGIWFLIPALYMLRKENLLQVFVKFILPILVLVALFYFPYIYKGYFRENTLNYVSKRFVGESQSLPNNNFYTFKVYNPNVLYIALIFIGLVGYLFGYLNNKHTGILVWFAFPFILFGLVFKNPGTHILHFVIPLLVLSAIGIDFYVAKYEKTKLSIPLYIILSIFLFSQLVFTYFIFTPSFGSNYPWADSNLGPIKVPKVTKSSQLFLYGFLYNRKWENINVALKKLGARDFYTNDNAVVAKYYVKNIDLKEVGSNFYPSYFVDVSANQEFKLPDASLFSKYTLVTAIKDNNKITAKIFSLNEK